MSIKGIDTMAGVVDPDWTAEIKVVLFNHMSTPYDIKCGDRIAQLILERVAIPVVKEIDSLPTTERGSNGFGSTGK
jgi:dUTP pyrophosphatase